MDIIDRLLSRIKVDANGCFVWCGSMSNDGYGLTRVGGSDRKTRRAHRLSYEVFRGPIPDGHFVCHSCDNPKCINPSHLFTGTPAENSRDMVRKQRSACGERASKAGLKASDIAEIFHLYRSGLSAYQIAEIYGIAATNVLKVLHRKTWRHIKCDPVVIQKVKRGSSNGMAKISESDVVEIRRLCAGGLSQGKAAKKFGLTQSSVNLIVNRTSWKHVA